MNDANIGRIPSHAETPGTGPLADVIADRRYSDEYVGNLVRAHYPEIADLAAFLDVKHPERSPFVVLPAVGLGRADG